MSWDELHILDRLRQVIGEGQYPGPVAEADIAAAEETLGARFPASFRVFLKHFGAAWLSAPYEVAGLGPGRATDPEPPLWQHVVDVTAQARQASRGKIPREYVCISDDGGDYRFYLDTGSSDANRECAVVVLGPGRDGVIVAASFLDFVERAVEGQLAY
jgi:hypothetical protein